MHVVFPHLQDPNQDTVVDGVLIPRGSMIIVNSGGIFEDPDIYDDPLSFKPERFLDKDVLDSFGVTFGYARRYAPFSLRSV